LFPRSHQKGDANEKKILKLVDGIALLLVTEAKADVAAVSFHQTAESINFYYAKNRLSEDSEKQYIESILDIVRSFDQSKRTECTRSILDKAIRKCIEKVKKRIHKVMQALTASKITISTLGSDNLGDLQIQQKHGDASRTLSKAIEKAISKSSSKHQQFSEQPVRPDKRVLADYFRRVITLNQLKDLGTEINAVSELIAGSYVIGMIINPPYNEHELADELICQ